ncbi:MAG: hypothetical protein NZ898_16315, partial [Myxococcota bacterium]|nr:hypothetical protein [Myxococcota bacterium]
LHELNDSFLYSAGVGRVTGIDDGPDVRDVAVDGNRVFLLVRGPDAVVFADRPAADVFRVRRLVEVGEGASRLALGRFEVGGRSRTLLFVSSYGSRDVHVLDADAGLPRAVVRGFSGPFALLVDERRRWLYVADFRASCVRVVDLAPLLACLEGGEGACEARVVGTLGRPRPVVELQ